MQNNILLNQINSSNGFSEYIPPRINLNKQTFLVYDKNIRWSSMNDSSTIKINIDKNGDITLDSSLNVFDGKGIHFSDQRMGIGRIPLYNYKFDIGVPENTLMTALHIGDGTYGLSFGNGTGEGFLPQIIGIGSDENDAGLYFLSKTGKDIESNIPLIILDARRSNNESILNRPLLGISNAEYSNFKFLVYPNGNVKIDGIIKAKDFIIDTSLSMLQLLNEINKLKNKIKELEEYIK